MRRKFINISYLSVVVFCLACSATPNVDQEITGEQLNIDDPVVYANSPFQSLIDQTKQIDSSEHQKHFLTILDIGDEALSSRVHLIRQAQKAIYIQTFIWSNDESGRFVARELVKAAQRGVKVKIIIDMLRLKDKERLASLLASGGPNMEVKFYNPATNQIAPSVLEMTPQVLLKFKKFNQRMHNKIFIVDDQIAMTGGRNYENDYFDRGHTRNFKDRDAIIIGPVVKEMTYSFQEYWNYALSVDSKHMVDLQQAIAKKAHLVYEKRDQENYDELFGQLDRDVDDSHYIQERFVDTAIELDNVRFVYDRPGKNKSLGLKGSGHATKAIVEFLSRAEKEVIAQSPYLVLDKSGQKVFKKLRRKHPDIDILISSNSLAATDNVYAFGFSYKQKRLFMDKLGFRIFELKPVPEDIRQMMPRFELDIQNLVQEDDQLDVSDDQSMANAMASTNKHMCIHAKTFVVDDYLSWIGSYNVDPRSAHLNTEVGLIIEDENVARALKENILRDMHPRNSWTIGIRQDTKVVKLTNDVITSALEYVPLVDLWPFRRTASFELNEGKEIVPYYHEDFYEHYTFVGGFPGVPMSLKEIQIRLIKSFAGFAEPII